jgi:aspartate aminotransferase-like enzyme
LGDVSSLMVRLNHTGQRATAKTVLSNIVAYGRALEHLGVAVDVAAATQAVANA